MATTNTMADSEQIIRNLIQGKPDSEVTASLLRMHSHCMVRYASEMICSSSAFYSEAPVDDLTDYTREASIEEMIRLHTFGITKGICLIEALGNMDEEMDIQMQPFIALFDALRQQRLNQLEISKSLNQSPNIARYQNQSTTPLHQQHDQV